jgi:hypothetical protein
MSRTDALLEAIRGRVEADRGMLDAARSIRRAEVIILFDEQTGDPREVALRTDSGMMRLGRWQSPRRVV